MLRNKPSRAVSRLMELFKSVTIDPTATQHILGKRDVAEVDVIEEVARALPLDRIG